MTLMKDVYTGSVSAGDVPVTYYDSAPGAADAQTIVLLHGTGGSAENNFWALFPMLAMRHRVVALDFVDPETPGAQVYLDQVQAVVQAVGGPVHLVGYSFGAVIGALYAARHGRQLASLTLVAGWLKTDTQQRLRNNIWRSLYDSGHEALAPFSVFTNFSQAFLNAKNDAELEALIQGVRKGRTARARWPSTAMSISAPRWRPSPCPAWSSPARRTRWRPCATPACCSVASRTAAMPKSIPATGWSTSAPPNSSS